jgi:hypothetical protein
MVTAGEQKSEQELTKHIRDKMLGRQAKLETQLA